MRNLILTSRFSLLTIALGLFVQLSAAQFNSGSTGADGALDTSQMSCPSNVCHVQLPETGVLNFTSVNIESTKVVIFRRNSRNTPATLLAQGNVVISGIIDVSNPCTIASQYGAAAGITCTNQTPSESSWQSPGIGGFSGGTWNTNGLGPGGGIAGADIKGRWVGPLSLFPIVGGSGGAGYTCGFPINQCPGSGGGGAISIASSTSINVAGSIRAFGGGNAGSGAGGAIRLVANAISFSGSLHATSTGNGGYQGVIRVEATNLTFTGSSFPLAVQSVINPSVVPVEIPRLSISSVGGYSVPANSGNRFDLIDVLLPNQIADPVPVSIAAQNIPIGTEVLVRILAGSPSGTSTPCNLTGTFANSSCTATISNLARTGGTYLLATAAFDPPASVASFNPKGTNYVAKIVLESTYGGQSRYKFLRRDGTEIEPTDLSARFLSEFGM